MDAIDKIVWANRLKTKLELDNTPPITSKPFNLIDPDAIIMYCSNEYWINPKYNKDQLIEMLDKTVKQELKVANRKIKKIMKKIKWEVK